MSGLRRGLGLTSAASLNIANMIGTGVFLKARVMTCNVESPGAVLAVWGAAALLVLAGALTYAELAAMMPRAGGEYAFLRHTYGRLWGFLYGWMYSLVSRGASLAAQAVATALFFNILLGGGLTGWQLTAVSIGAVALAAGINCAAVSATGRVATALSAVKIAAVFAVGAGALMFARGDWMHYALSGAAGACEGVAAAARGGVSGFAAAMLGALWAFQGWANFTPLAGEVRDPQRNIPGAFFAATTVVAALYVLANAAYFYALSPSAIADLPATASVATEVLRQFLGRAAGGVMAMAMMISSFGALHSGVAATARVPYAMAADGLFFPAFARLSARGVPVIAVAFVAVWPAMLAVSGSYDKLTDWAMFFMWLFYALNAACVIVLRRREPDAERPYRVWGYPVVPVLFLLVTAWILINTLWTAPVPTLVGLGVMLAGLPFYRYWTRG
ncbi:MAG: APC family permease [Bryobacteraceae bacterium]